MSSKPILPAYRIWPVVLFVGACTAGVDDSTNPESASPEPSSNSLVEGAPGYTHLAARSHLDLQGAKLEHAGSILVTQGTRGVHSLDTANGFAVAHSADPEIRHAHPFRGTAADHNQLTREAYVTSGLPDAQIRRVLALGVEREWGTLAGSLAGEKPETLFEGYLSRVEREVSTVPVIDSFTLARFNGLHQAFLEIAFWPAVPKDIVDEAHDFQTYLKSPANRESYFAKLPPGAESRGEVVIRHTLAGETRPLEFFVVFDVIGTGTDGRSHYDERGDRIKLPFEQMKADAPTTEVPTLTPETSGVTNQ